MKKDVYAIIYAITTLVIAGAVAYYVFFLQKDIIKIFNKDGDVIAYAARQEGYSQELAKAAVGMGYAFNIGNKNNFNIFQAQIGRAAPDWRSIHNGFLDGSDSLGIKALPSDDLEETISSLKLQFTQINTNISNLQSLEYPTSKQDLQYISMRASIREIINAQRRYETAMKKVTTWLIDQQTDRKAGFSLIEKIVLGSFFGILLLQALFIVRPLVRLAGENFLSANKAYIDLKNSEKKLKISFAKQKQINKQLIVSRKELEEKNARLQESESKLLKSTEEQIAINEQLINAQDALNKAYAKLQDSEKEIRELADKQLEDNEKLFLAEKQMKKLLAEEKKSKDDLSAAMNNLKEAQSQLVQTEKMASLGQLTAGIAHEINNPVNFISSGMNSLKMSIDSIKEILEEYSQLDESVDDASNVIESVKELKEDHEYDEIMDELDELIKDVNYGVTRTIEIVKGLRVFSRLDEEQVKPANVNENLDATLVLLRNKTKNKVKISKFYDENMQMIDCYPGQLNQVFMNILNNAIQAIPEERKDGEVEIYTEEMDKQVMIRIKDNGTGIPDEIKNRIWEPFFTTKAVGVGTGLGMSITYGIIEKHNGKIDLISEVGKGTEFAIYLPKKLKIESPKQEEEVTSSSK